MAIRYEKCDPSIWTGRRGDVHGEKYFHLVETKDMNQPVSAHNQAHKSLIGFCCDAGVKRNQGRPGASKGPEAIRKSLANLSMHSEKIDKIFDYGNVVCDLEDDLEKAQALLTEKVKLLQEKNAITFVLGGGHETALPHFMSLTEKYNDQKLGIINFDAHFDLREPTNNLGSSGTPFWQIERFCKSNNQWFDYSVVGIQESANTKTLFNKAKETSTRFCLAKEVFFDEKNALDVVEKAINKNDFLYVTVCLDVFSSSIAPGVSAPQPFGILPQHVIKCLDLIKKSNKMVAMDVVELCPIYDKDSMTAKLAAGLIDLTIQ